MNPNEPVGQIPNPEPQPEAPQQEVQLSPELQQLFMEAMFWKQKYFELQQHSNQVISMLSRPPASQEQVSSVLNGVAH